MPPKTKRYIVRVKIPILNTWRMIAQGVTSAQAKVYTETCQWEVNVEEENDDSN